MANLLYSLWSIGFDSRLVDLGAWIYKINTLGRVDRNVCFNIKFLVFYLLRLGQRVGLHTAIYFNLFSKIANYILLSVLSNQLNILFLKVI